MNTATRKSRIVQALVNWAYYFDDRAPSRASFCAIFWRCLLGTPGKIVGIAAFVVGVIAAICAVGGFILYLIGTFVAFAHAVLLPALAICALILLATEYAMRARGVEVDFFTSVEEVAEKIAAHPVTKAVADIHRGICPIIDLTPYR